MLKEICKSPPKLRMRDASHVAAMLDAWTDYVDAKCNLLRRCISPPFFSYLLNAMVGCIVT